MTVVSDRVERKTISVRAETLRRIKDASAKYPSIDAWLTAVLDREERRRDCEQVRIAMSARTPQEIAEDHEEAAFFDAMQDEVPVE